MSSPANGATASGPSITYQWNASAGATKYWLIVSTNPDWTVSAARRFNSDLGDVTQYNDSGYPDDGTTFYWWVWAGNTAGWSLRADVETNSRSFTNGSPPVPPSAPTLSSPADGAAVFGTSITYQWNAFADATEYRHIHSTPPRRTANAARR